MYMEALCSMWHESRCMASSRFMRVGWRGNAEPRGPRRPSPSRGRRCQPDGCVPGQQTLVPLARGVFRERKARTALSRRLSAGRAAGLKWHPARFSARRVARRSSVSFSHVAALGPPRTHRWGVERHGYWLGEGRGVAHSSHGCERILCAYLAQRGGGTLIGRR